MPTFECSGLMNPKKFVDENINKNDFKKEDFIQIITINNFVLNGLSDPFQKNKKELNIEKNNNNNIDDKEKQLCKSVARNIKENTRWFNKERSYEESLGSHCF
tara:strand:- start:116 stop:424 length:309 start_codon:yes stop_codon:yes gene_type:complete